MQQRKCLHLCILNKKTPTNHCLQYREHNTSLPAIYLLYMYLSHVHAVGHGDLSHPYKDLKWLNFGLFMGGLVVLKSIYQFLFSITSLSRFFFIWLLQLAIALYSDGGGNLLLSECSNAVGGILPSTLTVELSDFLYFN